MKLFRDEVYEAMEKHLKGPSDHNGIEDALRMINADAKLHAFIRQFAIRNGISCRGWGDYGYGNDYDGTLKRRHIVIWQGKDPYSGKKGGEAPHLFIGPDPTKEIMPVFLGIYHHEDGDTFWEPLMIEEKKDGFFLRIDPYKVKSKSDYFKRQIQSWHRRRIIDMGIFDGIAVKEILGGLEKAIAQVLKLEESGGKTPK